jgi:uncharacterized membrane protein YphA (DoxX/SURF4 family)
VAVLHSVAWPSNYFEGFSLQRLFSTFARGWPGAGLFLQRLITATLLFHSVFEHISRTTYLPSTALQMIAAGAGVLLLIGLWTPLAGTIVAISELVILLSNHGDPWTCLLLAILGATLAMIGPGTWSVDARLFGRKEVRI